MGLPDSVSWYQKKIGTYDKQQWETTVEQRILHGLTHVLKKTAKLKTDLIDVDLVRGSSFPKAKPKHGLLTVTKLATIRWLLLPVYSTWWTRQTCTSVFSLLLVLYILQLCNMGIYTYYSYHDEQLLEHVSAYEVVIPAAMMLILSIIQSQIVSTNSGGSKDSMKTRSRRLRRTKRRPDRTRSCQADCKSDAPCYLSTTAKRAPPRTLAEGTTRRRNVAWGGLQREEKTDALPAQDVPHPAEDDGFESLNSNGSTDGSGVQELLQVEEEEDVKGVQESPSPLPTRVKEAWVREVLNKREDSTSPVLCRRSSAPGLCLSCQSCDHETDHKDTDSDGSERKVRTKKSRDSPQRLLQRRRGSITLQTSAVRSSPYSCDSDTDGDDVDRCDGPQLTEGTTSAAEWIGITTNSEECSVTSEMDESDQDQLTSKGLMDDHPFAWEFQLSPSSIMSPSCASSDKVSCTIWESRDVKRADLSVLDISSAIIARVETMPENMDYFYAGLGVSVVIALLPSFCRLIEITSDSSTDAAGTGGQHLHMDPVLSLTAVDLTQGILAKLYQFTELVLDVAFGTSYIERLVIMTALVERFCLAAIFFFLIAVAERTFKQRFLYAKLFSRLTSFRRARKSELPHFRLNKVRNIKTWLSVRSYLKKRGPQRSVDVIVSAAFIITLVLLSFLSVEMLKEHWEEDRGPGRHLNREFDRRLSDSVRLHSEYNLEALVWCLVLGVYLLRFMTLGNKTNRKYRNLSVLLTEQINLYLQIEQKPNKKEELMVANSVLKLAADLLKELESPFKISGLSANPYVYTTTKVVILSALSGVLSEMLGFKLKLHKIKIK